MNLFGCLRTALWRWRHPALARRLDELGKR